MAARSISVSFKLGRLITENLVSNGKYKHYSCINQNFVNHWQSGYRQSCHKELCTATSEEIKQKETDAVEETENEKKLKTEIEKLTKEVELLTEKKTELENKYKRALADGENLRKRLTKQIEDAKLFGIQGFCKDLLEVADILSKATESVPKEEVRESNPHLKNLYEGLTMTEAQLQKVFKRNGLEPVNPLDQKFDPNFHEALFQQEVKDKEPGTVVVVSKLGYKLHERVIRPALVGVAKG